MSVKETTVATFSNDVLEQPAPVLVYFWATWCQPCKMMKPIIEQFDEEYGDKIVVVKVDADENIPLVEDYGVGSIPTFLVFQNGKVVKTIVGAKPKPGLLKELSSFL